MYRTNDKSYLLTIVALSKRIYLALKHLFRTTSKSHVKYIIKPSHPVQVCTYAPDNHPPSASRGHHDVGKWRSGIRRHWNDVYLPPNDVAHRRCRTSPRRSRPLVCVEKWRILVLKGIGFWKLVLCLFCCKIIIRRPGNIHAILSKSLLYYPLSTIIRMISICHVELT